MSRLTRYSALMLAARITLPPLLGFLGDQLSKLGGRERRHIATDVGKPRLQLGIGERGVDLPVELVDDLGRRILGRAEAIHRACLVARDELTDGRDVR